MQTYWRPQDATEPDGNYLLYVVIDGVEWNIGGVTRTPAPFTEGQKVRMPDRFVGWTAPDEDDEWGAFYQDEFDDVASARQFVLGHATY